MAITLAEFIVQVKTEINLGTEYDGVIGSKIRQAVRLFEKKLDFPYLRTLLPYALPQYATTINLGGPSGLIDPNLLKKVQFLRLENTDGTFKFVPKVAIQQVTQVDNNQTLPGGYWLTGNQTINLDRQAAQLYPTIVGVIAFTDWSLISSSSTHWLFNNAEQALLCQVLMNLAPTMREPELYAMYKELHDTEWDWLTENVESWDYEGTDLRMEPYNEYST